MTRTDQATDIKALVDQCDPDEPIKFLKWLGEARWHNITQCPPDTKDFKGQTYPPGAWDQMAKYIAFYNGQENLYYSINAPRAEAPDKKLLKENIDTIQFVQVDIDADKSERPLGEELARIRKLIAELPLKPSAIIFTGGGYQLLFWLSEDLPAWKFREWAETQNRAILRQLGGDPLCPNIDRVFRLPGTVNVLSPDKREKGRQPAIARIVELNDLVYSREEIEAAFPLSAGDKAPSKDPNEAALVKATMQGLNMDLIASVSDFDDLPDGLKSKIEKARSSHTKLDTLCNGDETALLRGSESDNSPSGFRYTLGRYLHELGSFDATEFGAWIMTSTVFLPKVEVIADKHRLKRSIARDWVNSRPRSHQEFGDDSGGDTEGGEGRFVQPPGNPMPNARAFLASEYGHTERALLIQQGGQFYAWDGTCWPSIDDPALRSALYRFFETKSCREGDKTKPFAPTARKVADLMDAMKAIAHIDKNIATPTWLDNSSQPAAEIVSCENGLVHWPTRARVDHRPAFYVHHSVPFAFDPKAPQPKRWLAFLRELWGDDQESIDVLQEMAGYLISGDTRQQKMFLLVGPKRGGKGTIARVLSRLLGRHNVAGPTLASLGTNFGLQGLIGKPAAIISDARMGNKSDSAVIAERLLSISGEDLQNVDRKFMEPWSGYLPTRFLIITNELPRFTDASGALASRFIVLMLQKSFYGQENPDLTEQLCQELPGIFNWALDGLERLRARGRFVQPSSSKDSIQEIEDLASPVAAFLRDCCKLGPDKTVLVDVLYERYRQWCLSGGRIVPNKSVFGRDLKAQRPEIKRCTKGQEHTPAYAGVALKTAGEGNFQKQEREELVPEDCNYDESKPPSGTPPRVSNVVSMSAARCPGTSSSRSSRASPAPKTAEIKDPFLDGLKDLL